MFKRKVVVCAASASLVALLMSSCGGSDSPPAPQAARVCSAGNACVTTIAGTGEPGNADGMAEAAQFWMPHSVAVDAESNVHVADYGNNNLTRLIAQGKVSTPPEDPIRFPHPANVATDANGNSYVADTYDNRILKVTPAGETTVLAGTGQAGSADGDASTATFSLPAGLAFDAEGALYVADMGNRKIRKITLT
jgi:serine/threonine-protein kinase